MYDKLKRLIENHNEQYQQFNDLVHSIKKRQRKKQQRSQNRNTTAMAIHPRLRKFPARFSVGPHARIDTRRLITARLSPLYCLE